AERADICGGPARVIRVSTWRQWKRAIPVNIPLRPPRGGRPADKPTVKRQGPCGEARTYALPTLASGIAAASE
ncbi:MAG: hypothetical protein ACLFWL_18475, partial [Candidatus Brocadiia bacterium]